MSCCAAGTNGCLDAGANCWEEKLHLKTSPRFATARFENLGDLDEISKLGSIRWLSAFCDYRVIFRPQSGTHKMLLTGADVTLFPS